MLGCCTADYDQISGDLTKLKISATYNFGRDDSRGRLGRKLSRFRYYASVNSTYAQPPPPAPASGYCGAFTRLVSLGGGAFANFALPGGWAYTTPGPFPSF